jgi:hypothetical protein
MWSTKPLEVDPLARSTKAFSGNRAPLRCSLQCYEPSTSIGRLMHSFQRELSPPRCRKPPRPQLYCATDPSRPTEPTSNPSMPFAVLAPRPQTPRRAEMDSQLRRFQRLLRNPMLRRNTGFENTFLNRIVRLHPYIGCQRVFVRWVDLSFSVFFSSHSTMRFPGMLQTVSSPLHPYFKPLDATCRRKSRLDLGRNCST